MVKGLTRVGKCVMGCLVGSIGVLGVLCRIGLVADCDGESQQSSCIYMFTNRSNSRTKHDDREWWQPRVWKTADQKAAVTPYCYAGTESEEMIGESILRGPLRQWITRWYRVYEENERCGYQWLYQGE
jgi:hypothetical protein